MDHTWLKSFRTVSFFTALSRFTGYLRDTALGLWIGPGPLLDAFFVVTRIASMGRAYFAEGMVNAMVPALSQEKSLEQQKKIIVTISSRVSVCLFFLCMMVSYYPAGFLYHLTPGFHMDERMFFATQLLGVMFWYLLQINIVSMLSALFHVHGRFAMPSFLPSMINICLIGAAYAVGVLAWPMITLAYAVIAAGFLQMLCMGILMIKVFGTMPLRQSLYHPAIKNIWQLMLAALAGTGVVQCSTLIDTFLATSLKTGAVSWVYYADRLVQLPLGVLGVSMMTVLLPKLSSHHADKSKENYDSTFGLGLECMMMLSMPMMCVLGVLSQEVVTTLFGYGKFSADDVIQTSVCLRWMALALPAIMVNKLISASSYAKGHVGGMVQAAALGVACNGFFAFFTMAILQQQAMALGMLLGAWVNVCWLFNVSSPLSIKEVWVRCRIHIWIVSWGVYALLLYAMHCLLVIDYSMGFIERLLTLCAICLPPTLLYAIFLLYMWNIPFIIMPRLSGEV